MQRGEKDTGLRPLVVMARVACRGLMGQNDVLFEYPARYSPSILKGLPLACFQCAHVVFQQLARSPSWSFLDTALNRPIQLTQYIVR